MFNSYVNYQMDPDGKYVIGYQKRRETKQNRGILQQAILDLTWGRHAPVMLLDPLLRFSTKVATPLKKKNDYIPSDIDI